MFLVKKQKLEENMKKALIILLYLFLFTNLSLSAQAFEDDFSGDLSAWQDMFGNHWNIIDGNLIGNYGLGCGSSTCSQADLILNDQYQLEDNWEANIDFTFIQTIGYSNHASAGVEFTLWNSSNKRIIIGMGGGGWNYNGSQLNEVFASVQEFDGTWDPLKYDTLIVAWDPQQWHQAKLTKQNNKYKLFFNNQLVIEYTDVFLNEPVKLGLHTYGSKKLDNFKLTTINNNCNSDFVLSADTYSETLDLDSLVVSQYGENSSLADWEEIKTLLGNDPNNLVDFYNCLGLKDEGSAMVKNNGERFYSTTRHYYLQRFDSGPYSGFLVHDQIGSLYLGSWYGIKMNILVNTDGTVGDIEFSNDLPIGYQLTQNYPNPFNPTTKISYSLPESTMVKLVVYDVLGSEIAILVNKEQVAGNYKINFDASKLNSGVYIYRITAGSFISSRKMLLIK